MKYPGTQSKTEDFLSTGRGVARRYQWTPEGELTTSLIWMYKVQ